MESFRLLPHTADTRLNATGKTAQELFQSALEGMAYIQKGSVCNDQHGLYFIKDNIQVKSSDLTTLLIDFLSEVLTLSHINRTVYCIMVFHKFSNNEILATVKGNKVKYFDEDIKAVTYHEAEVKRNKKNELETVIVFDI